jgi:hypothetical protein
MLREVVIIIFAPLAAFAGSAYTVQVIPPPSGRFISMSGINFSGQVAGSRMEESIFTSQAFIGSPSGSTLIPLRGGFMFSEGTAINDSGQVAGSMGSAKVL